MNEWGGDQPQESPWGPPTAVAGQGGAGAGVDEGDDRGWDHPEPDAGWAGEGAWEPGGGPRGDEGHEAPDADYGWYPRPHWRRRLIVAAVVVIVIGVVVGWAVHWVGSQINPPRQGRTVTFTVPQGSSLSGLAPALSRHGVIGSTTVFRIYLHMEGAKPIHPGTYHLHQHEAYKTLLATLAKGPPMMSLTVPEGLTLAQVAARVGKLPGHSAAHFLEVARSGAVRSPYEPPGTNSLEGLLFPATYSFQRSASDKAILEKMVDRFDQQAAALGIDQVAAADHITPYQAVIVASLVVREAKLPADRGKVARVVYNRLNADMPLQIDATVIYALGGNSAALAGHDPANVVPKSPYNTYRVKGLPPTPIADPGLPSLKAALHPTAGPWLYYVVVAKNGAEAFSSTYAGQQANIALAKSRGLPG